jgi:hypothetical protein
MLASLCLAWQMKLSEMPPHPDEIWGVSAEDLHTATCIFPFMHVVDIEEETIDDIDSENGREELPIDDELLDAAEEFALADEYHHQVGDGLEEGITWIEQWEDDVLDMDPQSSPSKRARR